MWESWLEERGLPRPKTTTSSDSSAVSKQQVDLAVIIQDMLSQQSNRRANGNSSSQRWMEVSINELNTRLWRWSNILPASCRWNRWGSNLDPVYPHVAALHMLYHTTLVSLNCPLLASAYGNSELSSPVIAKTISDATSTCETSADIILSILHRFKAQHGLRTAPLIFVHGTILAVEAILATVNQGVESPSVPEDTTLSALDSALEDLSYTWELAGHARKGLQSLLGKRQLDHCGVIPTSSTPQARDSRSSVSEIPEVEAFRSSNYLPFEYLSVGFDLDPLSTPPSEAFGAVGPYFWSAEGMVLVSDENF